MDPDVGFQGIPPGVAERAGNPEALKYGQLWERPEYRAVAPGQIWTDLFLELAKPRAGATLIDFGCGTGRAALALVQRAALDVTMVDFVRNCLDPEVRSAMASEPGRLRFLKADLEQPIPAIAEYGYCTDVLEHIPPASLNRVVENVLRSAKSVFFAIATFPDRCGKLIGEDLHLSVHDFAWWQTFFATFEAKILWSQDAGPGGALFYVSAWEEAQVVVDAGVVNTEDEQIKANVRWSCSQGFQQVVPHPQQDTEIMLVGGGWSLPLFKDDIRTKREDGVKLVTLNGSYNWCLQHGMTPSATVIVDAREFNKRFTKPVVEGCKYFLASQCHPSVFEGLPPQRTYLWHVLSDVTNDIVREFTQNPYAIPGGCTVLLRAIPLLMTLGYHRFHLYGCDSCLYEGMHHSFAQAENDGQAVVPVMVSGGRIFHCNPWMIAQAREFITLIQKLGNEIDLAVYGDGLLNHIITRGAELAELDEGGNGDG